VDKIAESNRTALIKAGIRSLATLVPALGVCVQAWSEYESHKKDQRIDEMFRNLRDLAAGMQNRLVSVQNCIETVVSEFPALFEKTVEKVQKEVSERKRLLFARALLNNLAAGPNLPYDDKLNIIEILDALTESDLMVLNRFPLQGVIKVPALFDPPPDSDVPSLLHLEPELSRLVVSLKKLESRGLIYESKTFTDSQNWFDVDVHWTTKWPSMKFGLLPFGRTLLDSLKDCRNAGQNA
jgi:hypothetical protein